MSWTNGAKEIQLLKNWNQGLRKSCLGLSTRHAHYEAQEDVAMREISAGASAVQVGDYTLGRWPGLGRTSLGLHFRAHTSFALHSKKQELDPAFGLLLPAAGLFLGFLFCDLSRDMTDPHPLLTQFLPLFSRPPLIYSSSRRHHC